MYAFQVKSPGFDSLIVELERAQIFDGLDELARRIATILEEDNAVGAATGTDRYGNLIESYAPLAPRTIKARDGGGPPLAPKELSSRIATHYTTEVVTNSPNSHTVYAGWEFMGWLWAHLSGNEGRNLPRRDIGGIRPSTWDRIVEAVDEWQAEWLDRHLSGF